MKKLAVHKIAFNKYFVDAIGITYAIVSAIFLFFKIEDFCGCSDKWSIKLLFLVSPAVIVFIYAAIRSLTYNSRTIIDEPKLHIDLQYGDIIDIAFSKGQKIVVINVNSAFDTIVDPPNVAKPLVSERTIHGQWLKRLQECGVNAQELYTAIKSSLDSQGESPIRVYTMKEKPRGNLNDYSKGTIALYSKDDTVFYLLALSTFDSNNVAHSSVIELQESLYKLVDYIGSYSQETEVFIPVMGCGSSRTGIDEKTALNILTSQLLINKCKLRGNIHVIVYDKHRNKTALY